MGMSDGAISLRHRSKSTSGEIPKKKARPLQRGSYLYRMRNQACKPDTDNLVIKEEKRAKDAPADKYLRKYQHHDALDAVIGKDHTSPPKYVISVILELSRRDALEIALSNRNSESLSPIINFLTKNVTNPSYGKILIPVANLLIDMYSYLIGQDFTFDSVLGKLRHRLSTDLKNQEDMIKLAGAIEQIFSMATVAPSVDDILLTDVLPSIDGVQLPDLSERTKNDENHSTEKIDKSEKGVQLCDLSERTRNDGILSEGEDTTALLNGLEVGTNGHDSSYAEEVDFVIDTGAIE